MKVVRQFLSRPFALLLIAPILWIIGMALNLDWWWFGGVAWAVISGYAMYRYGLWLAGPHVLPIKPDRESRAHARAVLDHFASGNKTLMAVVREGKVLHGSNGKPREGQGEGAILVDSTSVVALATDTGLSRLTGPGVHFTRQGEKIGQVIDLRPQGRSKDVEAQTRDGIWVKFKVIVRFQIDGVVSRKVQEIDQQHERWPEPYLWSPRPVMRALALQRAGVDQPVGWDEIPLDEAVKRAHTYIAGYTFDELTEPQNPLINRREQIKSDLDKDVKSALAGSGIKVADVKISQFTPRDKEIAEQRIKTWQSDWTRRQRMIEGEGVAESYRLKELARARGQMELVLRITQALEASQQVGADDEQVALRLLEVVERLAAQPEIGQHLSDESREALDQTYHKLLGRGSPGGAAASS